MGQSTQLSSGSGWNILFHQQKKLFRTKKNVQKNQPNVILFERFHHREYSGAVGF
jgi:hypothetical protein